RITNIRANASGVALNASSNQGQIQCLLATSGAATLPLNNSTLVVAVAQAGLTFSARDGANGGALGSGGFSMQQGVTLSPGGGPSAYLRFREQFASAFKTRTSAGFIDQNTSPPPSNQNT